MTLLKNILLASAAAVMGSVMTYSVIAAKIEKTNVAVAKPTVYEYTPKYEPSDRIKVVKTSEFRDSNAYGGWRSTFIITDLKTKQEYIGVSGVGVALTVETFNGKMYTTKEE